MRYKLKFSRAMISAVHWICATTQNNWTEHQFMPYFLLEQEQNVQINSEII